MAPSTVRKTLVAIPVVIAGLIALCHAEGPTRAMIRHVAGRCGVFCCPSDSDSRREEPRDRSGRYRRDDPRDNVKAAPTRDRRR